MNGRTDDVVRRPPEMPALVSLPLRVAGMTECCGLVLV
ncbi:hypothetical protein EP837_03490 [Sphingobium sp. EP60837]|nr:hypothetical protein EP837_03490 [Sphingobium sp. EP60837]